MTQEGGEEAMLPWDAARVNLTSRELAPGVFAVMPDDVLAKDHVGTTRGSVIGKRECSRHRIDAEWRSRLSAYRARAPGDGETDPLPRQHELSR